MSFWRDLLADKERDGRPWSAGRIVALLFAVTYNLTLLRLGDKGVNIGWPWATLGIVVLLAIPIQKWLSSPKHGPELVKLLLSRIGVGEVGGQIDPRLPSRDDDERGEPDQ